MGASISRSLLSCVTTGLLLGCTSSAVSPDRTVRPPAPNTWGEARAPQAPQAAEATPTSGESQLTDTPRPTPSHPPPLACQASCPDCRLLYDESEAQPSQGRPLTDHELSLVRRAYAEYLDGPECSGRGLSSSRIGSEEDIGQVFDVLDGSFTERNRRETLVLFFAGACGRAGDATRSRGTRIFALLREGTLTASFLNDEGLANFDRLLDINGDGTHEVVVVGGWAGKGGLASWISLRSFAGARDRALGFFNTLESGCGWSADQYWASRVRYGFRNEDGALCFLEQRATLQCPPILVSDR